jgi:alpha-beta hydrolase superfamily lysophospholipase
MLRWSIIFVFLCLAACGPRVQEFGPQTAPPQLTADRFITGDGVTLPVTTWPAAGSTDAVIIALHGFQMYSGHFQDAGPWWAKNGITTIAYDQRGHGGAPERGIWGGVAALTSDAAEIAAAVKRKYPGRPVFLLGASMGGAVVLATVERQDLQADGIILIAPAVWGGDAMHPVARTSIWLAAHIMPWNHASASNIRRQASDNIPMLKANGRDKMNVFQTRFDTLYGLTGMMAAGFDASAEVTLPTLVLYGQKDEIIPAGPVYRAVERMPGSPRFVVYPDGWHMLLRDLQAETVWRDVAAWVKNRQVSMPSGFEVKDIQTARSPSSNSASN